MDGDELLSRGVELPPHVRMTPAECLGREARNHADYAEVIVIGVKPNGELISRSSEMTRERAVFMLLKALRWAEGD